MRTIQVVLALALGGCGASALAIANGAGIGVSTAALACDWQQTRRFAEVDWRQPVPRARPEANAYFRWSESNPVLGPHPSTGTVDVYFAGALAASLLAWYLLPRRWRLIVPIVVTAIQVKAIANTVDTEFQPGLCGASALR